MCVPHAGSTAAQSRPPIRTMDAMGGPAIQETRTWRGTPFRGPHEARTLASEGMGREVVGCDRVDRPAPTQIAEQGI